ncbi:FUC1 [Symbiodinium natans]|uniref:alpha-L-fucosidase n=1 Tax=Symbiodinium natans TaxID=878477 RepID=A0A812KS20_9DINO|nr:FUC1 [Symbiodinium natans]
MAMHWFSGVAASAVLTLMAPTVMSSAPVAKPTAEQLQWQDYEIGLMVHWNLQTICAPKSAGKVSEQRCQADSKTEGPLYVPSLDAVAQWNPSKLDTDQWARAAVAIGAKYVVMVVDHMTGFTWFNTKFHNFSVAHTQYKGGGADLLREYIDSCRKYGLKVGFFYSVHYNWFLGVDDFKLGHPPLGGRNYTTEEYLAVVAGQLEEIVTAFGKDGPMEVWFDGGLGPHAGFISELLMGIAPRAICHSCSAYSNKAGAVRWMGNEAGVMPLPSWAAASNTSHYNGDPRAAFFVPPSCDIVLREHYWFHQNDTEQYMKSPVQLLYNYLTSVGRASNLIVNLSPDGSGAIPDLDMQRYEQLGQAIKCLFSEPLASSKDALDALPMDVNGFIEWSFPVVTSKNVSIVLREDQHDGQLIGDYLLECRNASSQAFEICRMGAIEHVIPSEPYAGIGHKRILMLAPEVPFDALRLVVWSHYAVGMQVPTLRDIELFDWTRVEHCLSCLEQAQQLREHGRPVQDLIA